MMTKIQTSYDGQFKSSTQTPLSEDTINVDHKFGPIDLLMGAYGSCMLATVDYYARKKGFEVNGSHSELSYELHADGDKVGKIKIRLSFNDDYPVEQKETIETSAKDYCHVGNSLNQSIVKSYEFIYGLKG